MQGATCPEWLKDMQRRDIEAGPGRRILWVPGDPKPRIKRREKPKALFLDSVVGLLKKRVEDYQKRAEPTVISMSSEATDAIDAWAEKHELRTAGNEVIDSLIAGDEVAARKVALIHAAIEASREISILHLKAAIAFVEFLYLSRFPIFSEHGLSPLAEIEAKILQKVKESMPAGIGWRDLRRAGLQRVPREDFARVMKVLTVGMDPPLKVSKQFGRAWVWLAEE
jgi:hypothetical protein